MIKDEYIKLTLLFRKNLKHLRKITGMTQEELADYVLPELLDTANYDGRSRISNYENGHRKKIRKVTLYRIVDVFKAYNITIEELLYDDLSYKLSLKEANNRVIYSGLHLNDLFPIIKPDESLLNNNLLKLYNTQNDIYKIFENIIKSQSQELNNGSTYITLSSELELEEKFSDFDNIQDNFEFYPIEVTVTILGMFMLIYFVSTYSLIYISDEVKSDLNENKKQINIKKIYFGTHSNQDNDTNEFDTELNEIVDAFKELFDYYIPSVLNSKYSNIGYFYIALQCFINPQSREFGRDLIEKYAMYGNIYANNFLKIL